MANYVFSVKFAKLFPNIVIHEQMKILAQVSLCGLCVALLCVSRVFTTPLCHLVERRITGLQSKKKLASYATYLCFKTSVISVQFLSSSGLWLWRTGGYSDHETGRGLERLYRPAGSLKFWFMRKNKSFLYPHTQTQTQRSHLSEPAKYWLI